MALLRALVLWGLVGGSLCSSVVRRDRLASRGVRIGAAAAGRREEAIVRHGLSIQTAAEDAGGWDVWRRIQRERLQTWTLHDDQDGTIHDRSLPESRSGEDSLSEDMSGQGTISEDLPESAERTSPPPESDLPKPIALTAAVSIESESGANSTEASPPPGLTSSSAAPTKSSAPAETASTKTKVDTPETSTVAFKVLEGRPYPGVRSVPERLAKLIALRSNASTSPAPETTPTPETDATAAGVETTTKAATVSKATTTLATTTSSPTSATSTPGPTYPSTTPAAVTEAPSSTTAPTTTESPTSSTATPTSTTPTSTIQPTSLSTSAPSTTSAPAWRTLAPESVGHPPLRSQNLKLNSPSQPKALRDLFSFDEVGEEVAIETVPIVPQFVRQPPRPTTPTPPEESVLSQPRVIASIQEVPIHTLKGLRHRIDDFPIVDFPIGPLPPHVFPPPPSAVQEPEGPTMKVDPSATLEAVEAKALLKLRLRPPRPPTTPGPFSLQKRGLVKVTTSSPVPSTYPTTRRPIPPSRPVTPPTYPPTLHLPREVHSRTSEATTTATPVPRVGPSRGSAPVRRIHGDSLDDWSSGSSLPPIYPLLGERSGPPTLVTGSPPSSRASRFRDEKLETALVCGAAGFAALLLSVLAAVLIFTRREAAEAEGRSRELLKRPSYLPSLSPAHLMPYAHGDVTLRSESGSESVMSGGAGLARWFGQAEASLQRGSLALPTLTAGAPYLASSQLSSHLGPSLYYDSVSTAAEANLLSSDSDGGQGGQRREGLPRDPHLHGYYENPAFAVASMY